MNKKVCTKHFQDPTLYNRVKRYGQLGECDYCNDEKERRVMEISDLGEFMQQCLFQQYDDAANWLPYESAEGGYQGTVYDTRDLIEEYLEKDIDEEVLKDLEYEIEDIAWCDYDPYSDRAHEILMKDWEHFKTIIQHKQRFTLFQSQPVKIGRFKISAADILKELGKMILRFRMVRIIPAGTVIYRCRQHEIDNISEAAQICSPPKELALYPNRMSPAGVSMFYGALEKDTAILETVNKSISHLPYYTIAAFSLKEDIAIVDFSKLPKRPSIFNPQKFTKFHWVAFLEEFVRDLSKPIKKDDRQEHIEYAPTQAVTEYIRYLLKTKGTPNLAGMIYPSSKDETQSCLVLFYNHEESLEKMKLINSCLKTFRI